MVTKLTWKSTGYSLKWGLCGAEFTWLIVKQEGKIQIDRGGHDFGWWDGQTRKFGPKLGLCGCYGN